jgi:hypothetical protein
MAVLSKFHELRIKTGDQLLRLINNRLALGIREARQALRSADTWDFAEDHYLRAKEAYAETARWIPLVDEIPEQERGRLEARREHLREMLEGLAVLGSPTGDRIPALGTCLVEEQRLSRGFTGRRLVPGGTGVKSQTACVGSEQHLRWIVSARGIRLPPLRTRAIMEL